jgi:hypothetical protein
MPWQVKELLTMKREFVMLAQQEGLPERILSDNGSPWGSRLTLGKR